MQAGKSKFGSCWRRRTFTNKILPAIVQAVIVVAIWEGFKLTQSSTKTDNSAIISSRSLSQSNCPNTNISSAKTLSILDLSSVISRAEIPSHGPADAYHSKVDIYARDEKKGYLILYPAGSLVDLGGIKAKIVEEIDSASKADEESSVVDIDDDLDTKYDKDTPENSDRFHKEDNINYLSSNKLTQKANFESKGNAEDRVERFKSEASIPQQSAHSGGLRSDASFKIAENQREAEFHISDLKKTQANKQGQTLKQTDNKGQPDPYDTLRKLHENLVKNMASVDTSPAKNQIGLGAPRLANTVSYYDNQIGYRSQRSVQNVETKVLGRGILVDEIGERLYAEGFLDRVSKLSVELFGKAAKNISASEQPIEFLINSPSVCSATKDIDVLFLINSVPENSDSRQRIRDSFVNPSYFRNEKIAHVFLVGKTASPASEQFLYQEHLIHRDIIQGDFLDAPDNDTYKGLMGLQWVTQFCPLAKYVMKINDFVFVDTDKLIHGLIPAARKINGKRIMLCYFNPESELVRSGPSGIKEDLFPDRSRLRPYCKGFAVLMTRGVVSSLLAASDYVPAVHLDELYLYGILPFVSGNIDVFNVGSKRAFHNFGIETVNCYKSLLDNCPFVASVALDGRFSELWDMVKTRMQKPHENWENERSLWDIETYRKRF